MGEATGEGRRGWTKAQQDRFFEVLEESSNVRGAARAAAVSVSWAHRKRRSNPTFAARWEAALEGSAAQMDAELLAHALGGGDDEGQPAEGAAGGRPERRFDPGLALKVLALRDARLRRNAREPVAIMPIDRIERRLLARLDALARRLERRA